MSVARVEQIIVYERDYDDLLAQFRDELITDGANLDDHEAVVRSVWETFGDAAFEERTRDVEVQVLHA